MLFKDDKVARAEHAMVRNNVGWYRWTHDLLEVKGSDVRAFLDYIFVNSIGKAPQGRSKYTTMLNEEGTIVDDVIVTHKGDDLYWISTLYVPEMMEWIDKHKGDRDVSYRDLTHEVDMYAIQGPNALKMLNALVETPLDDLKRFEMRSNKMGAIPVEIHRSGFTGELGYEVYCALSDTEAVADAITVAAKEFDSTQLTTLEVYARSLPMEKGFALRQDMYGLSPYEVEMGWSVDLDKDFVGKDAVVRTIGEGQKRKLVGLDLEAESYEDITQGERVHLRGVDVGLVRAAIYGYTVEKNIGFAVVDANKVKLGDLVKIGRNASPAVVVEKSWL